MLLFSQCYDYSKAFDYMFYFGGKNPIDIDKIIIDVY